MTIIYADDALKYIGLALNVLEAHWDYFQDHSEANDAYDELMDAEKFLGTLRERLEHPEDWK